MHYMNNDSINDMLGCVIQVVGRLVLPPEKVLEIVGTGKNYLKAYNLCDGRNSQMEVVDQTGIDQGSLSKVYKRWVENGVAFWIGEGKEKRLLHIYPLPERIGDGVQTARENRNRKK
jgi:hypothetical protein